MFPEGLPIIIVESTSNDSNIGNFHPMKQGDVFL